MAKTFLGVVHLHALPAAAAQGAAGFTAVLDAALRDAEALAEGGVDGILIENFGDAPFHKGNAEDPVTPDVVAGLAVSADRIRGATGKPVGLNCLRNDGMAALGVAAVCGADWVRVNVLSGAYVTDQGLIEGEAARLRSYRQQLGLEVQLLADFLVKHAQPLTPVDPITAARDLAERSGADGLVLSGGRTGQPVDLGLLRELHAALAGFPLWLGSGLSPDNAQELWPLSAGAIVGTALKRGGRVHEPVETARVQRLAAALGRV